MANNRHDQGTKARRRHERWAQFRFAVIGSLLAAPPEKGELAQALALLAARQWRHPIHDMPVTFGVSTIERWYYRARGIDPVGDLARKQRTDAGQHPAITQAMRQALLAQHTAHPAWSYQLHYDNLKVILTQAAEPVRMPSYATVRRFMKANGLLRRPRRGPRNSPGGQAAERRLATREVRSYEVAYVNSLWHLDFHLSSLKVLFPDGQWRAPKVVAILCDHSRLCCHAQWYLEENTENLVHALCQAIAKRALPRSLMTDNGGAMLAGETTEGLARLGIQHDTTLPYSPDQNGKQERFWATLEGRLLAMLEGVPDLTLAMLNEATCAWVELEYHRKVHGETGQEPLQRYLQGKDVGRPSPSSDDLRRAFTIEVERTQRQSDGTVSLDGIRMEIPSRYRHMRRVGLRYASFDLSHVWLTDSRRGTLLCPIYPLDKQKNADGMRRALTEAHLLLDHNEAQPVSEMAPLLRKILTDYAATGLPPAYIPKDELGPTQRKPHNHDTTQKSKAR